VAQEGSLCQVAFLVRGRDEYGHFDIMEPPKDDAALTNPSIQEVLRRFYTNIMEKTPSGGQPTNESISTGANPNNT